MKSRFNLPMHFCATFVRSMKWTSVPVNLTVVLPLLYILTSIKQVQPTLRVKNVRCHSPNTSVIRFEYCKLNAVRRDFKDISLKMFVVNKPIRKSLITIQFLKRSNGYKPFMTGIKVDACSYLKKRNNFILNTLMEVWGRSSNMNHTCPYDHDLIVEKLRFTETEFRWIPFPYGDYAFYVKFDFDNVFAAQLDFYLSILQD